MSHTSEDPFVTTVFPAELEEVRRRRRTLDLAADSLKGNPAVRLGLVGLAISGGGLRSATFALGVVQALAGRFLSVVDYLSTVSGGGFLGAALSTVLNDPDVRPNRSNFPLRSVLGVPESSSIGHLRDTQRYLAPGGTLESFRIPTLMLRGALVHLFLLISPVMLIVLLTELAYEGAFKAFGWFRYAVAGVALAFVAAAVIYPYLPGVRSRLTWRQRNYYELALTAMLLALVVGVAIVPLFWMIDQTVRMSPAEGVGELVGFVRALYNESPWVWVTLALVLVGLFMGRATSERIVHLTNMTLVYALGLLGPVVVFAMYLALCVIQIHSPYLDDCRPSTFASSRRSTDCDTQLEARTALPGPRWPWRLLDLADAGPPQLEIVGVGGGIADNRVPVVRVETVTRTQWKVTRGDEEWRVDNVNDQLIVEDRAHIFTDEFGYVYGIGLFTLLLSVLFFDINTTSLHGFYRDRLSRAFLFRRQGNDGIAWVERQRLSNLNAPGTAAPYQLVNVALNLQGSGGQGREADFFVFSKCFTGGPRTGYCKTSLLEAVDPDVDLAAAMAISGAAASPNAGTTTTKALVFLMTLLNFRLNYWLPNPAKVRSASWADRMRLRSGAGLRYLFKEAMSWLEARGNFVNLSDGGHLENLGIYELLRRRCAFIVAVDAEADPTFQFEGLVKLIRYARMDLGIQIEIDLDAFSQGRSGPSGRHWALGRVIYGEHEVGHLLYIKASLTGDEPLDVEDYRSRSPLFPHESTTQQFFQEEQFEAYRALGAHVGGELLLAVDGDSDDPAAGELLPLRELLARVSAIEGS